MGFFSRLRDVYKGKLNHRGWIAVSGWIWFGVGGSLLYKGLKLIAEAILLENTLCDRWQKIFGSPEGVGTFLIVCGLLLGFIKSRLVFKKSVQRVVMRIYSLPLPIYPGSVYTPSYWLLIGGMIGLGSLMRVAPIPIDLRGWIDVAIGSALIHGSMLYFRVLRRLPWAL